MAPGDRTDSSVHVLCVDDEPEFAELAAERLEAESDGLQADWETDSTTVLERLDSERFDCVVSDYDMSGPDGLELLEEIRDRYPDKPFILFTGKGSEEIASEAISAGVNDYLQKGTGLDQFTVLANRVENAVAKFRAEKAINEVREFRKLIEHATDVISIVDPNGRFQYLTPSSVRILGYEPEDLLGEIGFEHVHPEDRMNAMEEFAQTVENPDRIARVEFRFDHPDGWIWLESRARNMVNDPDIGGLVIYSRDITDRKERERRNERLEQFASVVSHDLRNPLNVAQMSLTLLERNEDMDKVEKIRRAHERMEEIIEDLLVLSREGESIKDPKPVELDRVVEEAWVNVETDGAWLDAPVERNIVADPGRLQQLLENLFRNTVDHANADVEVRVDNLEGGFFVEDDGPGIPADEREQVFEMGYSTAGDGTGFGLAIVREIADAHDWTIEATEGVDGGARFEITDVQFA